MTLLVARTRIVSRLNTVSRPLHNLTCAATISQTCSPAQRTLVTLTRPGFYKQTVAAPIHTVLRGSYQQQQRLNSTSVAAAAAPAADAASASPTSDLKIHNPQYDEAGKELTINITDNAVKQLKRIAIREKNSLALRITVDSGGCHGYQYLLDLTDTVNEDDVVFEKDGARVILDTITLPMVSGSRVDYIEELIGSAFKVLANPHAAHSCGCDTSFEIKI
ncbi:[4Fe-4S] proteins maturation [Mortierella sp. NVP41]|nr:[4Fe-4S] proteins maturation [Mortierella sp. NVP41]